MAALASELETLSVERLTLFHNFAFGWFGFHSVRLVTAANDNGNYRTSAAE